MQSGSYTTPLFIIGRDVHRVLEGQGLKSYIKGHFWTKIAKIADLQALNASRCDALRACRSAVFGAQTQHSLASRDGGV